MMCNSVLCFKAEELFSNCLLSYRSSCDISKGQAKPLIVVLLIVPEGLFSEQRIMNRRDSWEKKVSEIFRSLDLLTEKILFTGVVTRSIQIKIISISYAQVFAASHKSYNSVAVKIRQFPKHQNGEKTLWEKCLWIIHEKQRLNDEVYSFLWSEDCFVSLLFC